MMVYYMRERGGIMGLCRIKQGISLCLMACLLPMLLLAAMTTMPAPPDGSDAAQIPMREVHVFAPSVLISEKSQQNPQGVQRASFVPWMFCAESPQLSEADGIGRLPEAERLPRSSRQRLIPLGICAPPSITA